MHFLVVKTMQSLFSNCAQGRLMAQKTTYAKAEGSVMGVSGKNKKEMVFMKRNSMRLIVTYELIKAYD